MGRFLFARRSARFMFMPPPAPPIAGAAARSGARDCGSGLSVIEIGAAIVRDEGAATLFSGCKERVLRSAPQFGVTLALYDVLTQYCTDHGWLG